MIESLRERQALRGISSQSGQTMAEYATLLAILVIAIVATFGVFSSAVNSTLASHVTTILTGI